MLVSYSRKYSVLPHSPFPVSQITACSPHAGTVLKAFRTLFHKSTPHSGKAEVTELPGITLLARSRARIGIQANMTL